MTTERLAELRSAVNEGLWCRKERMLECLDAITALQTELCKAKERYGDDWEDRIKAFNLLATSASDQEQRLARILIQRVRDNAETLAAIDAVMQVIEKS